jgi:hypothetical protein
MEARVETKPISKLVTPRLVVIKDRSGGVITKSE